MVCRKFYVVPICKNMIMVQERSDGTWGLFGGKKNGNESGLDCAKREFFEETCVLINKEDLGEPMYFDSGVYGICGVYPFHVAERIMNVEANMETKGFSWVLLEDLEQLDLVEGFKGYLDDFISFVDSEMSR
jgi:8-oxo-dGTP pyrophosphatase MutT (NUDIX family)